MSHAVVMGGSIAGLCAAAALAKNFDQVTVLERDPEPGCRPHRGVPQGHQGHALLLRGQQAIETLLPGTFDRLLEDGARRVDCGLGFRWFQFGSWKVRCETGVDLWMQSRPLLEYHVRESVRRLGNVELRFEAGIEEPVHEDGRVRGVRMRDGELLEADLVVDATGRASRSTTWLEQWGYGRVKEQKVDIGVGYVSGVFELAPGRAPDGGMGIFHIAPHNRRSALMLPIENNRVMISFVGYHGDHAPTEIDALRKWTRTLARPDIYELLEHATLVEELRRFKFPTQVRRAYESMRRLPNNYLVMGDAMCFFDPTFAQGMSLAAMQAESLLKLRPGMSTARWQRKLSRTTLVPFSMTSNEAHRWAETTGWQPPMGRFQRWYVEQVFKAATTDELVYRRLMHVMNFLSHPAALFTPRMVARMWAANRAANRPLRLPPKRAASAELSLSSPLHQTGF